MVPGYSCKWCSSHATLSASRWLVGSSSSSRSGRWSKILHKATRRRSPPDSLVTSASPGGKRSASIAISSVRSRSQPCAASMASCNLACSSSSLSVSSGAMSSPKRKFTSSKRVSNFLVPATASSTLPSTLLVASSCGSCERYPMEMPSAGLASPKKSLSTPAMMRKSVDLPAPLPPMTPILAPGKKER